ncbi:MAG: hypothetical protein ABIJ09_27280 [Pseudomonadota bacterium]
MILRPAWLPTLVLLVGLLSCQSPGGPVRVSSRASAPAADAYAEILAEHSRRAHVYDWLADSMDLRATYHSAAYRQAFFAARETFHGKAVERMAEILSNTARTPDPIEEFAEVARPFAATQPAKPSLTDSESFFVALYVADQNYRTIHDDSTIWDTTLSVDGQPGLKPFHIERMRRSPSLEQVYPYLDKLDMAYVLYFPKQVDGRPLIPTTAKKLELRVVSKIADARLTWELTR